MHAILNFSICLVITKIRSTESWHKPHLHTGHFTVEKGGKRFCHSSFLVLYHTKAKSVTLLDHEMIPQPQWTTRVLWQSFPLISRARSRFGPRIWVQSLWTWLALSLSLTALSARSCHAATSETHKKTSIVCCSNWFLALHVLYYSLQFGTVDAEVVDPLLRTQSWQTFSL